MSGDVQPRKRKDKKRKKEEEFDEPILVDEPEVKEHGGGGNVCSKIVFFILLLVLAVLVGVILTEYKGSSKGVDTPVSESRFAGVFEGLVDETQPDHEEVAEPALGEDHQVLPEETEDLELDRWKSIYKDDSELPDYARDVEQETASHEPDFDAEEVPITPEEAEAQYQGGEETLADEEEEKEDVQEPVYDEEGEIEHLVSGSDVGEQAEADRQLEAEEPVPVGKPAAKSAPETAESEEESEAEAPGKTEEEFETPEVEAIGVPAPAVVAEEVTPTEAVPDRGKEGREQSATAEEASEEEVSEEAPSESKEAPGAPETTKDEGKGSDWEADDEAEEESVEKKEGEKEAEKTPAGQEYQKADITTDDDFHIRHDLDEADDFLDEDEEDDLY